MGQKKSRIVAFDDNSFYRGEVSNTNKQLADGKGVWRWDDNIYHGSFKKNKMSGKGVCIYDDGSYYKGNFKENMKYGLGTLYYIDGSKYIGNFENDCCHGKGKYIYETGDYFIGDFSLDSITGNGKLFDADNRLIYDGEWLYGAFHGFGSYFNFNKTISYEGLWKESMAHGRGKYYNSEGELVFDGYFFEGIPENSFEKVPKIKNKSSKIQTINPYLINKNYRAKISSSKIIIPTIQQGQLIKPLSPKKDQIKKNLFQQTKKLYPRLDEIKNTSISNNPAYSYKKNNILNNNSPSLLSSPSYCKNKTEFKQVMLPS